MLRDLVAADALASSLEATAPMAVAELGGAQALVAARGHPTGAWFWSVTPLPDKMWEHMADEHQSRSRANVGED
ncbi:hypothetical protein V5F38_19580 [Xanthobacter sp. V0B-10]|uniref:hypothetical protein n=1 Tax=Xanthobacter albus TaxID=3119929 RepID=UPI00372CB196